MTWKLKKDIVTPKMKTQVYRTFRVTQLINFIRCDVKYMFD